MSKSYDNYIGLTEPGSEQYGKTMSIPDALLEEWLRLTGGLEGAELERALGEARENPYRAKRALARRIVATYHDEAEARAAEEHFDRLFRQKEQPDDMPEHEVALSEPGLKRDDEGVWLAGLLVATGLASSNSEAVRLIEQGAVSVDERRVTERSERLAVGAGDELVLQRGKRHFARVRFR